MTFRAFGEFADDLTQRLLALERMRSTGVPLGPSTGFRGLDAALGGHLEPGLYVVHGQPGAGKTALALQIAQQCGFPSLYVTMEMAAFQLVRRTVARLCQTPLGSVFTGRVKADIDMENFYEAAAKAKGMSFIEGRGGGTSLAEIEASLLVAQGTADHVLLVVDSLHSWGGANAAPEEREYDYLDKAVNALGTLAQRRGIPIITLAERNRANMNSDSVAAGAGNRKIEYQSDAVISLSHVDGEKGVQAHGAEPIEAKLVKNRFGPQGKTIAFRFANDTQDFREIALEYDEPQPQRTGTVRSNRTVRSWSRA